MLEFEEQTKRIQAINGKNNTTKARVETRGLHEFDEFTAYLKVNGRLTTVQIQFQVSPIEPGEEGFVRFVEMKEGKPVLTNEEIGLLSRSPA
jgi:hypothetical protein